LTKANQDACNQEKWANQKHPRKQSRAAQIKRVGRGGFRHWRRGGAQLKATRLSITKQGGNNDASRDHDGMIGERSACRSTKRQVRDFFGGYVGGFGSHRRFKLMGRAAESTLATQKKQDFRERGERATVHLGLSEEEKRPA